MIWVIFFALCIISVVEVFSALSTLTYKSGNYVEPIVRHAGFLLAGIFIVLVVQHIKCRFFLVAIPVGIPLSVITLLMLLLGFGVTINGGARWLVIFGIPFQPSELAKGILVVYTAFVLSRNQEEKGANPRAFKLIWPMLVLFCALIFPENLSTSIMLFAVIIAMMFIGRVSLVSIGKFLTVIAVLGLLAVGSIVALPENTAEALGKCGLFSRVPTWRSRIVKHMGKETKKITPQTFDIDGDAQIGHSSIAIASSNVLGKGPGNSVQRDFIPQAYSDFIYAVIVEELGFVGAMFVVALYLFLLLRVGYIAKRFTGSCFPPFLAMGLALLLVVQAMANMLVATGIMPVTGQPLPLISRGGTSTIVNCVYIGIILSVSRLSKRQDNRRRSELASANAAKLQPGYGECEEEEEEEFVEIPPAEQTARDIAAGNFDVDDGESPEEKA